MLVALLGAAWAAPVIVPEEWLYQQLVGSGQVAVLAGSSVHGERAWADALAVRPDLLVSVPQPLADAVRPWTDLAGPWPVWKADAWVRSVGGNASPVGLLGDQEPGLFSQRLGGRLDVHSGWFEAWLTPELGVDLLGGQPVDLVTFEAWAAVRWRGLRLGFGARERTLGPTQHGALAIGDGGQPWPAGELAWEGRLPVIGQLRAETSVGWLPGERHDVLRPGVLHMDLRWAPIPWVEVGASRVSLFGGTELDGTPRPLPPITQLLVPTDPHVEDDPDRLLPDQDELAVLDLRLVVPLHRWIPGPVDGVEAWYQYGGEDMIVRSIGPLPSPALAGVANLYGVRITGERWWLTGERAVLMSGTASTTRASPATARAWAIPTAGTRPPGGWRRAGCPGLGAAACTWSRSGGSAPSRRREAVPSSR